MISDISKDLDTNVQGVQATITLFGACRVVRVL
jgi:hypothetical protein